YVWAVAGIEAQPISIDNRVVGIRFEDDSFRYVRLGGLLPEDPEASLADQSRQMFRQMILGLGQGDMGFNDVVRTWFFNRDILSWYSEFNQVRNDFFRNQGVFEGLVPASTGIGGNNPFNAALTGGLLAVQPKTEKALVHVVPSPLQNSALEYGSSFSRAVELTLPTSRRLLVSGTASIGPDGLTRHVGDVRAQMEFTLEVVQEILQSREMDWPHVVRAYAYLRETEEEEAFWAILKDHHLDRIPLITACQTICRDDLLFEIEVEARGPHHELPKNRRL
ncbi:MAG: endoribonuclease L-PSP, partial [Candidatus Omnitrophica bacterium]|nr:endoribonuclease L-PSP [Candidatus Omnitrophota bacterium]